VAQDITAGELKEKIDSREDFVLVDVLDEQYYQQSHLPDAINLPLESVDETEAILPDKSARTIV